MTSWNVQQRSIGTARFNRSVQQCHSSGTAIDTQHWDRQRDSHRGPSIRRRSTQRGTGNAKYLLQRPESFGRRDGQTCWLRLDPLAREVIYSKQHLLERPYRVGQEETLVAIAAKYEVPWQLLANINQVTDPMTLLPGTELRKWSPVRSEPKSICPNKN